MQLEAGLVAGGLHPVTASPSPSTHHSGATSVLGREDLGPKPGPQDWALLTRTLGVSL